MRFQHTVLGGLLKLVPRGQFARLAVAHGSDRGVRRLPSWGQLVALVAAQLAGCRSLRELEALLQSQPGSRYHLGLGRVCRSTLAVANAKRPAAMFADLLDILLARLADRVPERVGREALRLMDSTTMRLSPTLFAWARFSADYGGVKLHLVYDPAARLPTYFTITPNKVNDITPAKDMPLEAGATYVMDRGYYDFGFWAKLDAAGCRFVTRLKGNSPTYPVEQRPAVGEGILADQTVRLSERLSATRKNPYEKPLREIVVARPEGEPLRLVSNDLKSPAEEIAGLYKSRWQIELFFKWIKQNLKIKSFLGTSENAVRLQIIAALIAYLLLHYAHRLTHAQASRQRFRQLVQAGLWQRRPLTDLAQTPRPEPPPTPPPQLTLALP
jgi:transposase